MLNSWISNYNYSKLFILVDETTNEFCLPKLLPLLEVDIPIEIIEIEAGEEMKNISTCVEIWSILADLGADRKSAILNLGGGVITDLGGFVASTFKRGIDFINIPTTLLGMVDAAIGGKNGVDLGTLKIFSFFNGLIFLEIFLKYSSFENLLIILYKLYLNLKTYIINESYFFYKYRNCNKDISCKFFFFY